MGGGPAVQALERLRQDYPLALHGVGLSLGRAGGIDRRHLARLTGLVELLGPALVSDHVAWSVTGGAYLNHLPPLRYDEETLAILGRMDQAQTALGWRLLVENPSSYLRFRRSTIPEPEFLAELARGTGCGLLCDVNNVYVSAQNLGFEPERYLDGLPPRVVGEIHLAGHSVSDADGHPVLIEDHGGPIAEPVWRLYRRALARFGAVPTLIEWDTDLPELRVLLAEARTADRLLEVGAAGECGARVA
jgi:uncharacterized protein (UPF0276 family)